ncbi:hypothetical protein BDQ17DRAFT_1434319 [Cyathus striatus]|nr:hypothetical protein BDQ17DRAFT_1434319 [Cyathus striatus]
MSDFGYIHNPHTELVLKLEIPTPSPIGAVSFSPMRTYIAWGDDEGVVKDKGDVMTTLEYEGFISSLVINYASTQVAFSAGFHIGILNSPFNECRLPVEQLPGLPAMPRDIGIASVPITDIPVPIFMVYMNDDMLIVAFFGKSNIIVYSTQYLYRIMWQIETRSESFVGSCAYSPYTGILAVANLYDGIDWYSICDEAFMFTTKYNVGDENDIVGIKFMDGMSVVATQGDGRIVTAPFLTTPFGNWAHVKWETTEAINQQLQMLDFGVVEHNKGRKMATIIVALNGVTTKLMVFAFEKRHQALLSEVQRQRTTGGSTQPIHFETFTLYFLYGFAVVIVAVTVLLISRSASSQGGAAFTKAQ